MARWLWLVLLLSPVASARPVLVEPPRPLDVLRTRRLFTPAENAWHGEALLRALALVREGLDAGGLGPCRIAPAPPAGDPAKPASLVGEGDVRSACGAAPRDWRASLACARGSWHVSLLGVPLDRDAPVRTQGNAPIETLAQGPDWLLVRPGGPLERYVLAAGELGRPSAGCNLLVDEVAPPRAALVEGPERQGRELPQWVDPGRLAAALRAAGAPPPRLPPTRRAGARALRTQVYDALLRSPLVPPGAKVVAPDETLRRTLLPLDIDILPERLARLAPDLVARFAEDARTEQRFPPRGVRPSARPLVVLDAAAWRSLFGDLEIPDEAGLKAFQAKHGDAALVRLSPVTLSRDGRQAMVEVQDLRTRARHVVVLFAEGADWVPRYAVPG